VHVEPTDGESRQGARTDEAAQERLRSDITRPELGEDGVQEPLQERQVEVTIYKP